MELIGADHELYDGLRRPAQPRYAEIRPRAIARCASPDDVAEALAYARSRSLPVAPRGGGHCFAGRSSTTGLLIDLSPMDGVSVEDRRVTVGAGARLVGVYRGLYEYGLTLPAGCGATVGIVGLTLGGGLGLLGRRYGLTCDRLADATVVLANGNVVRGDDELLWALRGAGGGFGVVTSLVFDAVPSPAATRFRIRWARERAADVIAAWQDWAPDAADDVTASLAVAGDRVEVFGASLGAFDRGPFADGELEVRDDLSWPALKASLSEDGDGRVVHSKSEFVHTALPRAVIADLLGTGCDLNFTPMGGAYNRVPADATAFAHRDERFLLEHTGPDRDAVRRSWSVAHPHASGHAYPNFPDPEVPTRAYHGVNYERLLTLKRKYDPTNTFRSGGIG
ncbi:FAD-binding oxidoreductase [Kribbella sp. WER1]